MSYSTRTHQYKAIANDFHFLDRLFGKSRELSSILFILLEQKITG